MKLSEAILLGSTQLSLDPRFWLCNDGGCLIGMGGYAAGVRYIEDWEERQSSADEIEQIKAIWPWISEDRDVPQFLQELPRYSMVYPYFFVDQRGRDKVKAIISSMACHIKVGHMTLEQAVDWIRENEPQEPEAVQPAAKEEKIYAAQ